MRYGGGKFTVPKPAADAGDRCLRILKSVGSRAKNLNYLGEHQSPAYVILIYGLNRPPCLHSRPLSVDCQQVLQRQPHNDQRRCRFRDCLGLESL